MLKNYNPYTLRIEESEGAPRYFVHFKDGQAITHEIEISITLYQAFDDFRKDEKCQRTSFERHIEYFELTDEALNNRAFHKPESVDDSVIRRDLMVAYRRAVADLPDIQRRRFVLYYEHGLTYKAIGFIENCSPSAVQRSVLIAKEKITKNLKYRLDF